jgi:DNA-binding SARP family transcriptional activator
MSVDRMSKLGNLHNAISQWRGNVLTGASESIINSPGALCLERERAQCACDFADLALAAGRAAHALSIVESLAARLPYDEALHARLIKLLGVCGKRAEGLLRFIQIRKRLAEDLGVEPSRLLTDEYMTLL